jgi:hypothetical protein
LARISETAAHLALRPYYQSICESVTTGYQNYLNTPDIGIHSPRTVACNVNDHVLGELINRLDGFAEPYEDRPEKYPVPQIRKAPDDIALGKEGKYMPTIQPDQNGDGGQNASRRIAS